MPLEVLDALVKNVNQRLYYTPEGATVVDCSRSYKVVEGFSGCGLHANRVLFKLAKHVDFTRVDQKAFLSTLS